MEQTVNQVLREPGLPRKAESEGSVLHAHPQALQASCADPPRSAATPAAPRSTAAPAHTRPPSHPRRCSCLSSARPWCAAAPCSPWSCGPWSRSCGRWVPGRRGEGNEQVTVKRPLREVLSPVGRAAAAACGTHRQWAEQWAAWTRRQLGGGHPATHRTATPPGRAVRHPTAPTSTVHPRCASLLAGTLAVLVGLEDLGAAVVPPHLIRHLWMRCPA